MARKKGLTLDQHQHLGSEPYDIRNRLLGIINTVGAAHPKAARSTKAARKALDSIDSLRATLDSLACRVPGNCPKVYYPGPTA